MAAKAGSVSVSFPGLAPRPRTYRTLATQADIETVGIFLTDARTGHSQHLDRQALERPRVDAAFKSVATGPITLRVEARDADGTIIGAAEQEARLGSGEHLVLRVTVALIDSGNVSAEVRFEDGDGFLSRHEVCGDVAELPFPAGPGGPFLPVPAVPSPWPGR